MLGYEVFGRHCGIFLFFSIISLFFAPAALAQSITGSIGGTVSDTVGTAIPGVEVRIFNVRKAREERLLKTDSSGNYAAPLLQVGTYNLSFEITGFRKAVRELIILNAGDSLTLHQILQKGDTADEVVIRSTPVQMGILESSSPGSVVRMEQAQEMSLVTRNFLDLIASMPGAASSGSDQPYVGVSHPPGTSVTIPFSINGIRNSSGAWQVDGADVMDHGANQRLLNTPSLDSIEEVKVFRDSYAAEMGNAAGAQINVITKSGQKQFHGSGFEFLRNEAFAANNFMNNANNLNLDSNGKAKAPALRYNDFGWTFGGPIYVPKYYPKDQSQTYFFFSEEFRRAKSHSAANAILPTSTELSGTFPHLVCVSYSGSNCISSSKRVTKIATVSQQYITDIFSKLTLATDSNANVLYSLFNDSYNFRQELVRVDQTVLGINQVSIRYVGDEISTSEQQGLNVNSPISSVSATNSTAPGRNGTIRVESTVTPHWLNEFGYSNAASAMTSLPAGLTEKSKSANVAPTLPYTDTTGTIPSLIFAGGSSIASFGPYRMHGRNQSLYDNITWIAGRHTFKFGAVFNYYERTENTGSGNQGIYSFSPTSLPSGATLYEQAFANFLLGYATNFTQTSLDIQSRLRQSAYEVFLQDDWRLTRNFTVNLGARYSNFRSPYERQELFSNFDPSAYVPANAPKMSSTGNLPTWTFLPYVNGIVYKGVNSFDGMRVRNDDSGNIAPRIGFAWDPFGSGRTVVRGGYGLYYDSTQLYMYSRNIFNNPPNIASVSVTNVNINNPTAATGTSSYVPKALSATPTDYRAPYAGHLSLAIQHRLSPTLSFEVGYAGTRGAHLLGAVDMNMVQPGLAWSSGYVAQNTVFTSANEALLNNLRPYLGYNAINSAQSRFNSNYHSLQASTQKRFKGGSMVTASYTWSKTLTDSAGDGSIAPQNSYSIHDSEYGLAAFDRRHVFSVNFIYAVPSPVSSDRLVGKFLSGWQLSGIGNLYSGLPLTVTSPGTVAWSGDSAGTGVIGQSLASLRPDIVCDPNAGAPHTRESWFNTSCFAAVPTGQHRLGNAGRSVVAGPGYQGWDLSLSKQVWIGSENRLKLQFRADATNVLNHSNPAGFGSLTAGTTQFGTITGYRDPRIIQFGFKLYF
jgi:hypothetical protein